MKYVITSIVASVAIAGGVYFFLPLSVFESAPVAGATITTIQGTDTLSNSRTTINNNFSALNTSKAEISDVSGTTTLSSLSSIGTITTGVWNGTTITVPFGGTGSTTLSSNQVLLGNGTGILKTVSGWGTSGQSLVSNGGVLAPSWQSVSFDTTIAYTNTGLWTFNTGGLLSTASSTFSNALDIACSSGRALTLNALAYICPSSRGANETVLTENGSGTLTFSDVTTLGAGAFLAASTTDLSVNDTATDTIYGTTTVPANLLGTNGAIRVVVYATTYSDNGNNNFVSVRVKLGATTVCTAQISANNYGISRYEMLLSASSSAALQQCQSWVGTPSAHAYSESSSAIDTTTAQSLTIWAKWDSVDGGDTESFTIGGVEITFLGR